MRVLFLHFFFSCGICFAKDVLETSRIEENSKGRTNDSLSIFYEQLRRLETTAIDGCTESLEFPYRCYTTNAELGNAVIAPAIAIVVIRSGSASRKRQQHAPGNQQRREDTTTLAARTTLSKSCTGCPAFGLGVRAGTFHSPNSAIGKNSKRVGFGNNSFGMVCCLVWSVAIRCGYRRNVDAQVGNSSVPNSCVFVSRWL